MTDSMSAREGVPMVLVVNCGSSSVKTQLFQMAPERAIASAVVERIGEPGTLLRSRMAGADELIRDIPASDHREALGRIGDWLRGSGALEEGEALAAIGHRVVHGGERFTAPARIDERVCAAIRELAPLAPLHNPVNLTGIEVCLQAFPGVPQVAVFDTAFHHSLPPSAFRYAVPEEWYLRHGVRRYGFHGSSHRWLAERAAVALGRPLDTLRLITLHLGNGASAAAIRDGRSVETSMGLSPLEGLVMGTRSGDLDPSVALHVQRVAGLGPESVDDALNHGAGLLGLCGTNDVRELLARERVGDERAGLALAIYCHRLKKYLGAYLAVLGRADAIVFAGGVGENAPRVRSLACEGLEALGIGLDEAANAGATGELAEIGKPELPVRVLVIRTNEELQIARESLAVARALASRSPRAGG